MTATAGGTVYALIDPRDNKIRYIGATTRSLPARLSGHLSRAARAVQEWIDELRAAGLKPAIVPLLENVPADELRAAEEEAITRIIAEGGTLLNEQATRRGLKLNIQRVQEQRIACWAELAALAPIQLGGPLPPGDLPEIAIPDPVWRFMSQVEPGCRERFSMQADWRRAREGAEEMLWRALSPAWWALRSLGSTAFNTRMKSALSLATEISWTSRADAAHMLGLVPWYMVAVHPWRHLAELGALPVDDDSFVAWAGRDPGTREALEFLAARGVGTLARLEAWADTGEGGCQSGPGHMLGTVVAAYSGGQPPELLRAAHREMLAKFASDHMLTPAMADLLTLLDPRAVDRVFGEDLAATLDRDLDLPSGTSGVVLRELVNRLAWHGVGVAVRRAADRSAQTLLVTALPDYQEWAGPSVPYARTISGSLVRAGLAEPEGQTPDEYLAQVRNLWVPDLEHTEELRDRRVSALQDA